MDGPTFWAVLCKTTQPAALLPRKFAELIEIEFWPTWSEARDGLGKGVEPDVFLRFSVGDPAHTVTLIVECKLDGWQNTDQWAEQWKAHAAEYASEPPDECWLLALGGLPWGPEQTATSFIADIGKKHDVSVRAVAADWQDLLKALDDVELKDAAAKRIVCDIREALSLNGYHLIKPMAELAKIADDLHLRFDEAVAVLARWNASDSELSPPDLDALARWPIETESFRPMTTDLNSLRWTEGRHE